MGPLHNYEATSKICQSYAANTVDSFHLPVTISLCHCACIQAGLSLYRYMIYKKTANNLFNVI